MFHAFLPIFFSLLSLATTSASPSEPLPVRSRSLPRRLEHDLSLPAERDFAKRGPPSGWSTYVASGNDGGGCYRDWTPRILPDYNTRIDSSSVEAGLKACQAKGYKFAGLQNSNEVYCSNNPPIRIENGASGECSYKCSSGEACGGYWRMNIYTYTDPATTKWTSQGCYADQANPRSLSGYSYYDGGLTVAKCQATCAGKGYSYAAVEYGAECYCGNTITGQKISDQSCSMGCGGGGSGCGGTWTMSLYKLTSASSTPTTSTPAWNYVYCATDSWSRALGSDYAYMTDLTPAKCNSYCASKGYSLAGTQNSFECFCGNSVNLANGASGQQVSDNECSAGCSGGGSSKCGGFWRVSIYSTLTGSALNSALGKTSTVTTTTTRTTTAPTQTTTNAAPAPTSYTPPTNFPGGGGNKLVYAHFIVGNAYPYTLDSWRADIGRAQSAGLDGFFLNLGGDSWQPDRVRDAYTAAAEKGFKMVISFDMYEFDCGSTNRIQLFQNYLRDYVNHAAAGKYNGKAILTTFAGEQCSFGQGSTNNGWNTVMGQWKSQIYWAPAYNAGPTDLGNYELNAEVNWGSAWPVEGKEIETSRDLWYMQNLGGRAYIGTVSPLFYAGIPGKNFIWRGDNFLYGARWDQLLSMRDKMDIVQVVSWNDYGESTYINSITGDWPKSVKDAGYISDSFGHTALLSLQAFYSAAWKNGAYPAITKDQIWAMARPHTASASANGEAPARRGVTNDNLYVQVHLVSAADVILCSGACSTQKGQAGMNRFSQPLQVGSTASVQVQRNGQVTARVQSQVGFTSSPQQYNFNYWILSSS